VVAEPVADLARSRHLLVVTLLVTYPLLLLVLGLIAWRVIGAALRPVEALRSSAELISGTQQDTRLPVPTSGDEIHRLAVTLNSMLDRLAGARARQRAFVADAAHELRSPLASMQTQIDVQQRVEGPSWQMQELEAEVRRMTRLVDDLLVLARLDADTRPSPAPDVVDLAAVIRSVTSVPGGRVPVTTTLAAGPPLLVRGRHDDLRRVLANLVDNAVRHARTAVSVTAHEDGRRVVVEVSDDGAGIPRADRERVFERFTRLDEGRARDAGGVGLGLSMVRAIVERHAGTVRIADAPIGGARLVVRLPAA
jgi:signal transduction histidine kinase